MANQTTKTKAVPGKAPAPGAAATDPASQDPATAATESGETDGLTLRGWIIERAGAAGEGPSWFKLAPGGGGWVWDRDKASVFSKREDAKPLVARKRVVDGATVPAGPASNEGAKIVKFDEGADD
ncbi:hypothetical protein [Bosea massiliensis]|uniref:DUF2793 domain-containing protein n=1 Tax=Bosea massiliensis TaxID=151419 RepID=A0ABW0PAQ2_9HYPH